MNKTTGDSAAGDSADLGEYSLVKTNLLQSCPCFCRDQFQGRNAPWCPLATGAEINESGAHNIVNLLLETLL